MPGRTGEESSAAKGYLSMAAMARSMRLTTFETPEVWMSLAYADKCVQSCIANRKYPFNTLRCFLQHQAMIGGEYGKKESK